MRTFFAVASIGAFFLAVFPGAPAGAQATASPLSPQQRAKENIIGLKAGALIVRLPSQKAKTEALQALINDTNTSETARRRMEAQLEETIASQREFNQNMMKAFREAYNFSDVLFFFDNNMAALKDGRPDGIFLDSSLQADPNIRLENKRFFLLGFGSTSSETSDGVEAMIIMDDQLATLEKPFPFYQRLNDFPAFIGSILPAPNQKAKDAVRIVEKFNKKLHRFYHSVE